MDRPTLLIDNVDEFLPTHSVWDTAGGSNELATAVFLRGSISSSYGYIETQLNDLARRALLIPELSARLIQKRINLEERMSFLRGCFESFAPLAVCRRDGTSLIDEFLFSQPDRNDWAHGRLVAMPGHSNNRWDGASIKLELCSPGKQFRVRDREMSADALTEHARHVRRMAQRSQEVHWQAAEALLDQ